MPRLRSCTTRRLGTGIRSSHYLLRDLERAIPVLCFLKGRPTELFETRQSIPGGRVVMPHGAQPGSHLIAWNAIAEACRIAASPVIAATMCGRTPRVQPKAAMMPALEPRDRPAAMEYTAPVPAWRPPRRWSAKGNAHRSNLHVRALIKDTLLAVLGTLAERDAAVPKAVGSAERPATRRDRACAASGPIIRTRSRRNACQHEPPLARTSGRELARGAPAAHDTGGVYCIRSESRRSKPTDS